jgi:peptidoglycan/LPS O-acetylase OafA/YrhL
LSLKYRPEIDGLRAISVIAVILYHAEFAFRAAGAFKGGFFGVDVFFVISGYLITLIILQETSEGRFSFARFYERRARRILMPLFVVMAASVPFAWALLPPQPMKEFAGSALSALGFGSNVWFLLEDSYTAEASNLKPLLHTWSLSVEEQFYLIFPLALLGLLRFSRQHLLWVMVLLLFLSLQLAHHGSLNSGGAAFYLFPTRAWELLAGGVLAKLELDRGRASSTRLGSAMPAIGVFLIIFSFCFYDDSVRHPSYVTAIPVAGTMLVVWFATKDDIVSRMLSSKPFVSVGLISYSLYLWHFPIFALARSDDAALSDITKLLLIAITGCLAVVTFFLVERPVRAPAVLGRRKLVGVLVTTFGALFLAFASVYATDGAAFRYDDFSKFVNMTYWSIDDRDKRYRDYATYYGCWVWVMNDGYDPTNPFGECRSQEGAGDKRKILVIGDSHAAVLMPGLIDRFGRDAIAQRTASTCFPSPNVRSNSGSKSVHHDYCLLEMAQAYSDIERIKPDLILIAGSWQMQGKERIQHEDFFRKELLPLLGNYKDKTIIVGPLVRWNRGGLRKQLLDIYRSTGSIPRRLAPLQATFVLDEKMAAISRDLGLRYLSPAKVFCDQETCLTKVSERPEGVAAWDRAHLSIEASKFLIDKSFEGRQLN